MKPTVTATTNIVAQNATFIVSCNFVAHTFDKDSLGKPISPNLDKP